MAHLKLSPWKPPHSWAQGHLFLGQSGFLPAQLEVIIPLTKAGNILSNNMQAINRFISPVFQGSFLRFIGHCRDKKNEPAETWMPCRIVDLTVSHRAWNKRDSKDSKF